MYVHGRRGRNFIKTLGEYNKNYLHTVTRHAEKFQALDGRQEQQTLVAKLLLRISHLDELHPWELQIDKILLEYIEGHP